MHTWSARKTRAVAMLVLTNILWGISFPVMKLANLVMESHLSGGAADAQADATWRFAHTASFLVALRFTLSFFLLCLVFPRILRTMRPADWYWGMLTGLAFSAGMILQNMALNEIPASRSGFLTSLTVVFTPLLLLILHRQMPRGMLIAGITSALLGTAILTGIVAFDFSSGWPLLKVAESWRQRWMWGDSLTLLAAIVFAGQILLIDRASRTVPAGHLTPGMFLATLLAGSLVFLVSRNRTAAEMEPTIWLQWMTDLRLLGLVLLLSLFCTILAFHLMNIYQPAVSPSEAAVIYSLEPLFATLWAMCLPGLLSPLLRIGYRSERPGLELIVGGVLLALSNILALWPARGENRPAAA